MRHYQIFIGLLIFTLAFTTLSCKKDDKEEESGNYMVGGLEFNLPRYTLTSKVLELEAKGVTTPTTGITYKWSFVGIDLDTLEGAKITITTPATPTDWSITLNVSHEKYNSKQLKKSTTTIDPTNEEYFSGVKEGEHSFIDERDGSCYHYSQIGNLYWFTTNLKWSGESGSSYDKIEALTDIFGLLYTWEEATGGESAIGFANGPQGVCPEGWRVPTREDWEDFGSALMGAPLEFDSNWSGVGEKAAANALLNGVAIWKFSPNNEKRNSVGWNGLPGGSSSNPFKSFSNINQFGFWWSASEADSQNGEFRFIHFDSENFPYSHANKSYFAASVRCVKEVD